MVPVFKTVLSITWFGGWVFLSRGICTPSFIVDIFSVPIFFKANLHGVVVYYISYIDP